MKFPRLITRRRAKWVLTFCSILAALVFVLTIFVHVHVRYQQAPSGESIGFMTDYGTIMLYEGPGFWSDWKLDGLMCTVRWQTRPMISRVFHLRRLSFGSTSTLTIPMWPIVAFLALPSAYLWCTDRRAKPWQCPKCRYDLRGLEGVSREGGEVDSENRRTGGNGVCPECGRVVDQSNRGEPSAD